MLRPQRAKAVHRAAAARQNLVLSFKHIVSRRPTALQPAVYFMLKPSHGANTDSDRLWKLLLAYVAINGCAFQPHTSDDFGQAQDFDGVLFFGTGEERQIIMQILIRAAGRLAGTLASHHHLV